MTTQEKLSPWTPDTNKTHLRVLGKALEELTECGSAVARCIIQGIDESEPVTGKPNRQWLQEEIADAYATLGLMCQYMKLDKSFIFERSMGKALRLRGWIDEPLVASPFLYEFWCQSVQRRFIERASPNSTEFVLEIGERH